MNHRRLDHLRLLLTQEAARLMVTESISDYQLAKEKAADRLGIRDKYCLPRNEEIDLAAAEYNRLFASNAQAERLRQLRQIGLEAMEFLQVFDPYLTGAVASGTAGEYAPILLELYTDAPEQVIHRLQDAGIPYAQHDFQVTGKTRTSSRIYPKITFLANDVSLELLIFPDNMRQQKVSGKERLSLKQLRQLLQETAAN